MSLWKSGRPSRQCATASPSSMMRLKGRARTLSSTHARRACAERFDVERSKLVEAQSRSRRGSHARCTTAYDLYLRAFSYPLEREGIAQALDLTERAIERDPRFGPALALLAA